MNFVNTLTAIAAANDYDYDYIAIGPNCWGRGETVDIAVHNMKREVASMFYHQNFTYTVWQVSKGTTVGGLGNFTYPLDQAKPRRIHEGNSVLKRRPK